MPKPSDIITVAAGLMNDTAQTRYTNFVCLPMLNLALDILQETYELNGLPITTQVTSAPITLKAGTGRLGPDTVPAWPVDLIEPLEMWESPAGLSQWVPMVKKDTIPHYLEDNTQISLFIIWALEHGRIVLIPANADIDVKLDYTCSIFNTPILIGNIEVNLPFTNIKTYLEFETAALCALFIAENQSRAQSLESEASMALQRSVGIPVKGMQTVVTRRRPFRHSYKSRGVAY